MTGTTAGRADGGILLGLIGLVAMVPFLVAVAGSVICLFALPRTLAHAGILIDADGLEVVEKPRFSTGGLVRSHIPWGDVQAIVARRSAAMDEHGIQRYRNQAVTDIYLRGDTGFRRPGVGLSIEVTSLQEPVSAYVGALASFPAVRLRLPHSQKAEDQTAQEWTGRSRGRPQPAHPARGPTPGGPVSGPPRPLPRLRGQQYARRMSRWSAGQRVLWGVWRGFRR